MLAGQERVPVHAAQLKTRFGVATVTSFFICHESKVVVPFSIRPFDSLLSESCARFVVAFIALKHLTSPARQLQYGRFSASLRAADEHEK